MLKKIAREIEKNKGRVFYVGGYVRDKFLGKVSNDIDVEVYGITQNQLINILSKFGEVNTIGKSFGIVVLKGLDIDFAMPRSEVKTGEGHKGFDVTINPFMDYKTACKRRDFTMNAIMEDVLTGEVIDPFNGARDIQNKVIRHIDDKTFVEDPLRVYRAMQFAGRFNFTVASETRDLCKNIDLSSLPKERIYNEFIKLLLKSERPSVGMEFLRETGILEKHYSLLHDLLGCPQSPTNHPEGDVWAHTLMVLDEAAKLRSGSKNPISFMWAALLHDIGKPITTEVKSGMITSYGHDKKGEKLAVKFLNALTEEKKVKEEVADLVRYHMRPRLLFRSKAGNSALRRLSNACDIEEVLLLSEADYKGRDRVEPDGFDATKKWINGKIRSLSLDEEIKPLVRGRDLISLGLSPGPNFGIILKQAFELQIQGYSYEDIMQEIRLGL